MEFIQAFPLIVILSVMVGVLAISLLTYLLLLPALLAIPGSILAEQLGKTNSNDSWKD